MTCMKRIALVIGATLALAACGSGSGDDAAKNPDVTTRASVASSTSSATTAPEATTTSTTALAGDAGSREAPIAMREFVELGDWFVRVLSVDPDAADAMLADNDLIDPPADGNVFFLVELEGVFQGNESASIWNAFFFNAVGASGVAYDEFEADCGFFDGSLSQQGEVFPGGTVSGFECFEVSASDAETLMLYLEGVFSFSGDDRTFFALREGEGLATGVTPGVSAAGGDSSDVGTRSNPVALGSLGRIGDWYIRLNGVDIDATDRVLALSDFNEAPPSGHSYVLADVEVTYVGSESSSFWFGIDWSGVGPSNVAVDTFESSCGTVGGALDGGMDFYTNGTAEGPLCLSVPDDQIDEFVLFFDVFGEGRQFFAIHQGVGEATDVVVETVAVDPGTAEGSQGNPVAFETEARVADWDVAVVGLNRDGVDEVLAEAAFNDPPADGNVFLIIDLEGTYRGDDSSTLWADTSWSLLLPTNVALSGFDASCGSIPDDLAYAEEAFDGGTVTGSICFEVPAAIADQVTLIMEDFTSFDDAGSVFFDLG
jgi:hypothetical protein